ncbi:hypothetical protein [Streptomyces sp. NPDC050264]|uniref:hypothetical protein n=1 Tax=Streptomyces sp. NPDC050264 TaxID=3155038 RepID=UPI0034236DD4
MTKAKVSFDGDRPTTVTGDPLAATPRCTGDACVHVAGHADGTDRERFLLDTFGSQDWLWDAPDVFRFGTADRAPAGVEPHRPEASPAFRSRPVRADGARDFRHERGSVLCRGPEDTVLTCLRDLDILDEPLEARIGIASDVALLVQRGSVAGWSVTDPARYLTTRVPRSRSRAARARHPSAAQ